MWHSSSYSLHRLFLHHCTRCLCCYSSFLTPYTSFQGKPVQALGKITGPLVSSTRNPTGSRVLDVESEKGHNMCHPHDSWEKSSGRFVNDDMNIFPFAFSIPITDLGVGDTCYGAKLVPNCGWRLPQTMMSEHVGCYSSVSFNRIWSHVYTY